MSEIKEMQSVSKQPDVLSKQYIEASKLHQHIIASAELAQQKHHRNVSRAQKNA